MLFEALARPDVMLANTIFHPEGNQNAGTLGDSPFGFLIGAGAEGGETSFMIGVLQSRHISEAVTADTIEQEGEKKLIADLVLEDNPPYTHLHNQIISWFKPRNNDYAYQNKVVGTAKQIRSSMKVLKTPEGFIDMQIAAFSPEMAEMVSNVYITQLKAYYKKQRTEKAKNSVAFFTNRMDSLKTVLDDLNRRLAYYTDRNQGRIYAQDELYPADLASEQAIVQQMYVTVVLNREQALAQLQKDTPVIQVLDAPKPPHTILSSSGSLYVTIGLFLGFVLALFLVTRKMLVTDIRQLVETQLEQLKKSGSKPEEAEAEEIA